MPYHIDLRIGISNERDELAENEQGKLALVLSEGLAAQSKLIEEMLKGSSSAWKTMNNKIGKVKGLSKESKVKLQATVEGAAGTMYARLRKAFGVACDCEDEDGEESEEEDDDEESESDEETE